jgi:hypothetical protein
VRSCTFILANPGLSVFTSAKPNYGAFFSSMEQQGCLRISDVMPCSWRDSIPHAIWNMILTADNTFRTGPSLLDESKRLMGVISTRNEVAGNSLVRNSFTMRVVQFRQQAHLLCNSPSWIPRPAWHGRISLHMACQTSSPPRLLRMLPWQSVFPRST